LVGFRAIPVAKATSAPVGMTEPQVSGSAKYRVRALPTSASVGLCAQSALTRTVWRKGGPLDAQPADALAQVSHQSGVDLQVATRGADQVTQGLNVRQRVGASRCSEKGGLDQGDPETRRVDLLHAHG